MAAECEATLGGYGGLRCVRVAGHVDGHSFAASAGPDLDELGKHAVQEEA